MKYLYFPGCSLKSSGKPYEESLLAVLKKLQVPFEEIDGWNCCGATSYMSINELSANSITARNLALAEQQGGNDIIAPCAACYMGLLKTKKYFETEPISRAKITGDLQNAGLKFENKVAVRHPLDIFINDIGTKVIQNFVFEPLKGIKVACYYGCQLIRPYATFDDPREPKSMETIVKALGAEPVDWPLKSRCCTGSMTSTIPDVGMRLNYLLLKEAKKRGADVIITACPLCQFNLECFQDKISKTYDEDVHLPVYYFTQLMGVAFGLPERPLGLHRILSPSLNITK